MTRQPGIAEILNRECDCTFTDLAALRAQLDGELAGSAPSIVATHPHLFSAAPVFLDAAHAAAIRGIVAAVESVVSLPGYRQAVLAAAPLTATMQPDTRGVFTGFDFHISPDGPRLIEINSNAGGAFLNIAARDAQRACCPAAGEIFDALPDSRQLEDTIVAMFRDEWRQARGTAPLRSIAIVDEKPTGQFLYPEFLLARKLFESRGIATNIVEPSELEIADGALRVRGAAIDLVYNRLTDFYLEEPRHALLREAWLRNLALITPHPHTHALYASKRNLALMGDARALESFGASAAVIETLTRGIPETRAVAGNDDAWWRDRKRWFFKPQDGFGSRGAYRGDKMTRQVFASVMSGGYMAQQVIAPSERWRAIGDGRQAFKMDVRCYAYAGQVQFMVARLCQGQTTNFRTAGGGFAMVIPCPSSARFTPERNIP
jgi:hypothetical protein